MTDDLEDRLERVLAVVDVGRRIAAADDRLGQEIRRSLGETTALSPEGIELALTEHLESDPDPDDVDALVSDCRPASCCHVVLSPSVCIAAFRAVALAVGSSPQVRVKASRRDPTLAKLLVRELSRERRFVAAGGAIEEVSRIEAWEDEVVHAYGADETLRSIALALPDGATLIGHGSGFGVAVVSNDVDVEEAASSTARDVIAFDQRGCLSPRVAIVEGGVERARAFAQAAHLAFEDWERRVPRGRAHQADIHEIARYLELMRAIGESWVGPQHVVGLDPQPEELWIGPAFRVLHVIPMEAPSVEPLLSPAARLITAIGGDEGRLMRAVRALCPAARVSPLGRMQRPPFDGPVDRRDDAWFSR